MPVAFPRPARALDPRKAITQYVYEAWQRREGLPNTYLRSVVQTHDGYLWLASLEGLVRFDGVRFTVFSSTTTPDFWTPKSDNVHVLLADPDGSLWIGTGGGGLVHLVRGRLDIFTTKDGLPDDRIESLVRAADGRLFVGTESGVPAVLKGGRFARVEGLPGEGVTLRLVDRTGALWMSGPSGLWRLASGVSTLLPVGERIFAVREDLAGTLWVGTSGGLRSVVDGMVAPFRPREAFLGPVTSLLEDRDALGTAQIHSLFEDADGALWIATDAGLARAKSGALTRIPVSSEVFDLLQDPDGTLWMPTGGVGIARYRGGKLTTVRARQGLFADYVLKILDDGRGSLWMSTSQGVGRVARKDVEALADGKVTAITSSGYGVEDGIPSVDLNGGNECAGVRTRDGRLFFPTMKGLVMVDPAHLPMNRVAPLLVVEEATGDGRAPARERGVLVFPPGTQKLDVRYTANSLVVPKRVRFRYRLDGFDREWVDAGTERSAHYTNLPPRDYVFRVTACNDDGLWSETGASLAFTLAPLAWQTWWFHALEGLAGLAALALAFVTQRRRVLARADHARKTEELERARAVQLALLPKEPLALGGFTVAGRMETATEVGGDYFDYREAAGRLCVVMADATGHGLSSGLVAGMLKSALAALAQRMGREDGPAVWLAELNGALRSSIATRGLGVCAGLALVDIASGEVALASAGVPHPFVVRGSGAVERVPLSGTPLGYLKRISVASAATRLAPSDGLVLVTDGLLEQLNGAGEEWGYAGVEAALARLSRTTSGPLDLVDGLLAACEAHGAGAPRSDDRTVVVLARLAEPGNSPGNP